MVSPTFSLVGTVPCCTSLAGVVIKRVPDGGAPKKRILLFKDKIVHCCRIFRMISRIFERTSLILNNSL